MRYVTKESASIWRHPSRTFHQKGNRTEGNVVWRFIPSFSICHVTWNSTKSTRVARLHNKFSRKFTKMGTISRKLTNMRFFLSMHLQRINCVSDMGDGIGQTYNVLRSHKTVSLWITLVRTFFGNNSDCFNSVGYIYSKSGHKYFPSSHTFMYWILRKMSRVFIHLYFSFFFYNFCQLQCENLSVIRK